MLPLLSPPNGVSCWENPCLWGQKLFPFKFLFFKACFFVFTVNYLENHRASKIEYVCMPESIQCIYLYI